MFPFPMVYCLLPNEKTQAYKRVFEVLKHSIQSVPLSFMTDFEIAAMTSLNEVYETNQYGCFFHLGQCLWRKVQQTGLAFIGGRPC